MKHISILVLSLLAAFGMAAADRLYIENFDIAGGESKTLEVMLDNTTTFAAMQCDVVLPAGLSITAVEKATRCRNHTLTTQTQADGSLRVWISSMSSRTISGTSGVLFTVTVQAAEGFGNNKQLWLRNIVGGHETADAAGERIELPDTETLVNPSGDDFDLRGDVDGNGKVDVEDMNIVINIMLGRISNATYEMRSDLDGDGTVDVGDMNTVINIMLGKDQAIDNTKTTYTVGGVAFRMVKVVGGTFTMGATAEQGSDARATEKPAHQVTLSDYAIGETEVTQALWQAVMGSNPSANTSSTTLPVETVSWNDCQTFIAQLNQLTGKTFRLPTEAEWEFAARGGKRSKGYKYAGGNDLDQVAWWRDNSGSQIHPVGQKMPNELGLYDMSGNVYELVADWYGAYSGDSQTNPTGPATGTMRVSRGGGCNRDQIGQRVSFRGTTSPTSADFVVGLRLAM